MDAVPGMFFVLIDLLISHRRGLSSLVELSECVCICFRCKDNLLFFVYSYLLPMSCNET